MQTSIERAEWLINRALKDASNKKMKRALNASLTRARVIGDFERVEQIRSELRKLGRSMRKYRKFMAVQHPGGTASIKISVTEDQDPVA